MRKLPEEAFVTMGICPKCKKPFGITVDKADERRNEYVFVWAFKVNAEVVFQLVCPKSVEFRDAVQS